MLRAQERRATNLVLAACGAEQAAGQEGLQVSHESRQVHALPAGPSGSLGGRRETMASSTSHFLMEADAT
jgi:hypothetical protein